MLVEEARWFGRHLQNFEVAELSPLLNVGSQTAHFRQHVQPWIDQYVFGPLRARGVQIVHTDLRPGPGVDVVGDLTDTQFLQRLCEYRFRSLFCSNLLEHVPEPEKLAAGLMDILSAGGVMFVSCPRAFPYHPDPIDTGFRPTVEELADLFPGSELVVGEVVDCGPLWHYVVERGRAWLRERRGLRSPAHPPSEDESAARLGSAATGPTWKQWLRLAAWLLSPVAATCVVLRVIRVPCGRQAQESPPEVRQCVV
jgi:hypothetical protein